MTTQPEKTPFPAGGVSLDEAIAAALAALQALDDCIERMWARQTAVVVRLREKT